MSLGMACLGLKLLIIDVYNNKTKNVHDQGALEVA
jgi:hypothetical protein